MTTETAMDEHELNECKIARMKPREEDKIGWGHPVMMLLYAVLLIVGGFLLRGVA